MKMTLYDPNDPNSNDDRRDEVFNSDFGVFITPFCLREASGDDKQRLTNEFTKFIQATFAQDFHNGTDQLDTMLTAMAFDYLVANGTPLPFVIDYDRFDWITDAGWANTEWLGTEEKQLMFKLKFG